MRKTPSTELVVEDEKLPEVKHDIGLMRVIIHAVWLVVSDCWNTLCEAACSTKTFVKTTAVSAWKKKPLVLEILVGLIGLVYIPMIYPNPPSGTISLLWLICLMHFVTSIVLLSNSDTAGPIYSIITYSFSHLNDYLNGQLTRAKKDLLLSQDSETKEIGEHDASQSD
jgi:hypothetical protein